MKPDFPIFSADSHVLEPADLWATRMQARFRDRAPHLEHEYNGQTGDFLPKLKGQNAADIWRRQVYATFQDDVPGVRCRDLIGVDNLMWGSDYPHFDSTFPKSRQEIERNFEGVPEAQQRKILGETCWTCTTCAKSSHRAKPPFRRKSMAA